jgi:hypothetical protein
MMEIVAGIRDDTQAAGWQDPVEAIGQLCAADAA